jgi:hypothetical protein
MIVAPEPIADAAGGAAPEKVIVDFCGQFDRPALAGVQLEPLPGSGSDLFTPN